MTQQLVAFISVTNSLNTAMEKAQTLNGTFQGLVRPLALGHNIDT